MILFANIVAVKPSPQISERIIIVIDSYHDPVLLNFTVAIQALNVSLNGLVDFFYSNNTINSSTLSGVTALIIPPFNKTFTDYELEVLKRYVFNGGILILMALDYDYNRRFNMNPVLFNDLLSAIPLKENPRLNYTMGGIGLRCIDPLSNDSFIHIDSSEYFTEPLKSNYLQNKEYSLILEPTIITVDTSDINEIPAIIPPAWTYCISGNGTILYFESGATLFVIGKYGHGYVVVFGFAISLSDLENPIYKKPWIELGNNKEFWIDVLSSIIEKPEEKNSIIQPTYIVMTLIGIGILLIAIATIVSSKRKPPEKRREISISEALKKIRKKR